MLTIYDRLDMDERYDVSLITTTPHKLNSLENLFVPTELQKHEGELITGQADDGETMTDKEKASQECSKLCTQGTDPNEIQDCIGYCERLLYNTIEL